MKVVLSILLAAAVMLTGCTLGKTSSAVDPDDIVLPIDNTAEVMDNIVIVGYKDGCRQAAVSLIKLIDPNARMRVDLPSIKAVSFGTSADLTSIKAALKAQFSSDATLKDKIAYIEPSYKRYKVEPVKKANTDIEKSKSLADEYPFEDFYQKYQWGMRKINAPAAWAAGYTGSGIVVAVVDTGIDGTHFDLLGQTVQGYRPYYDELIAAGADSSYGGAHGTHVAGIIAARDDGSGVKGVAPGASVMPIVIFDDVGYIGDDYVAGGILWAAEHGATVYNNSWGGKGYSFVLADMLALVRYYYGAVIVASAGNSHTDEIHYPSCYPGVINVAASDPQDAVTNFSTRGQWVTVAAPGDYYILSTVPLWDTDEFFDGVHPYAFYGGTSMATPHVSGVAALVLEKLGVGAVASRIAKSSMLSSPTPSTLYTPYQIRKLIAGTADDIADSGFDTASGWGRVNAGKAVSESLPSSEGANLFINSDQPCTYVSLYPKTSGVPVYYGKADDFWYYLHIIGIEPGEYTLYAGSGDAWYTGVPVEAAVGIQVDVSLAEGDNTVNLNF